MRISTAGLAQKNGKFLLALRKPGSSIGESWEFPGGKVEEGESPKEALKREFLEEFQVPILVGDLIYQDAFQNRNIDYELRAYAVRLLNKGFTLSEHQKTAWFTVEEMFGLPMAGSDRSIVEFLRNYSH